MTDSSSFMLRMLQELVKKLEETVMILKLENHNLQFERGTLQGRVKDADYKDSEKEQLQNAIVKAETEKQSFGKKTAELDAKLKAAETGKRAVEEELAEWKKEKERLEKLCMCEEVVGEESEDDGSASDSTEFEGVHQVFENLKVGQRLGIEIIDLTQADDDDGKDSDTTRGDEDVVVCKAEIKEEPDCDEEYSENIGDNFDIPGTNGGDDDEIGNNCDAIINDQPAPMVSITSVALNRFSFQMDTNENDVSNINEETSPVTISKFVSSNKKTTKSKAITHERDYSKEPRIFCRCGKQFHGITELNRHLNNYNNRRFCCKLCEKRFRWGYLLRDHLLRKHNATMVGGSFSCTTCGGQFATRGLLFKHQQRRKQ
ncbi:unnamed protein product [Orchesella dallaii]|uniref:C2H2-type domain-containing protein n=1 Tax=Orchesella dallaii TaxID=48710 RepID=A0ABP1RIV9_9HEXA